MNVRPTVAPPAAAAAACGVLVLGVGNLLWADEGFGVRAVEALHQRYELPPQVSLVDGGTQGLYLLDHVCAADKVLVFDAIDYAPAARHAAHLSRRARCRSGPTA